MATNNQLPNFIWPDGSGFQFDLPPRDVAAGWSNILSGGVYEVPSLPNINFTGDYNGWTNWLDKFWKDYRFANVSDNNATANIFPEVQDPWMFTEYLYQGTTKLNEHDNAPTINKGIVEPPLVYPLGVAREYETVDGQVKVKRNTISFLNNQPPTVVPYARQNVYKSEHKFRSDVPPNREYWESDLLLMGWKEVDEDGIVNRSFTRLPDTRRVIAYANPVIQSGVRLYRYPVWANSTRWGQSGNIPPRIINLTAPAEYFSPTGMFTNKIVPKVTIENGMPIYDNAQDGEQRTIRYNAYGTSSAKIGTWEVTPTGPTGDPAGEFSYTIPSGMDGSDLIQMPDWSKAMLSWNNPNMSDGDLVHHGCTFWKGHMAGGNNVTLGKAFCDYYQQNASQFNEIWSNDYAFSNPNDVIDVLEVAPFDPTEEDLQITFVTGTMQPVTMDHCGKKTSYVKDILTGNVIGVKFTQSNGTQVPPVSPLQPLSNGGFVQGPDQTATITIKRYRKNKPYPEPSKCAYYNGKNGENGREDYIAAGGKCPYYTPAGPRVVASYSAIASNGAEWSNLQRGLPANYKKTSQETAAGQILTGFGNAAGAGGLGIAGFMAYHYAAMIPTPDPFTDGVSKEQYTHVTITYEPEVIPVSGKKTYYDTKDGKPKNTEPEQDLKVQISGYNTVDTITNAPYGGVDNVFFGMVNQINYRVMRSVMHCYKPDKCNKIITDPNGAPGWVRGRYSNINFTNHALRMPGYPGLDGSSRYCYTGNRFCPHSRLDRRAEEYDRNYRILLNEILNPFRLYGIDAFAGMGIHEAFIDSNGVIRFLLAEDVAPNGAYPNATCVAVYHETENPIPLLGHYQPVVKDADGVNWRVFFFYDTPSWDQRHMSSRVFAHIIQFDDNDNPCYMNFPESTHQAMDTVYQDHTKVPWLVELIDGKTSTYGDYVPPEGFCMYPTNAKSFAGGRHPEYRDHSKRGRNLRVKFGGTIGNEGSAATYTNQFGGPLYNTATVQNQGTVNYWIQKYGSTIVDGQIIALAPSGEYGSPGPGLLPAEGFVPIEQRIYNRPGVVGHNYPINGAPGLAIQDPENPGGEALESKYAAKAHTYSNDTPEYLAYLRSIWDDFLDTLMDDNGNKPHIAPPSFDSNMLPSRRRWYRCNVCGIGFLEEEVNFFKHPTPTTGPLYPVPSGSESDAELGCPRGDGGYLYLVGAHDRFLKTRAQGEVDIWAPPGTTVKHDAYFWKNPTIVNRTHEDQLLLKLGPFNKKSSAGGYPLQEINKSVNVMGRLPDTTARHYEAGIDRRLVLPFASPGETVQIVFDRVKNFYYLKNDDVIKVFKPNIAEPTLVGDKNAVTLSVGEVIHFYRNWDSYKVYEIGLPVEVSNDAPDAILNAAIVKQDVPQPNPNNYPSTEQGFQTYQTALRNWLIDVVYSSLQGYSTNMQMDQNALVRRNGVAAQALDPKTGQIIPRDERLLSPYAETQDGGMKMITVKNLKRMRNRILPMLAYSLTQDPYTAGGDYTRTKQASHLNRTGTTTKTVPGSVFGTIPVQIMAATQTGSDYYVEWETGDVEGTTERAYYPVGSTWWRMNQVIGQIKRKNGVNALHMDDATRINVPVTDNPYTGDMITSVAAFFLHGRIPMDKEVVRAYAVFTPNDAPEAAAIGCQGQYTGYVGWIGGSGKIHFEDKVYVGHRYCYWQHYHGYTTNHESDKGGYGAGDSYWDSNSKNHVDNHGDPSKLHRDDPNMLAEILSEYRVPVETQGLPTSGDPNGDLLDVYIPFVDTGSLAVYTNATTVLGRSFVDSSVGQDLTQPFLDTWSFGQDLKQKKTEFQIWKDMSFSQYDKLAQNYEVVGQAAVNTNESIMTFNYTGSYFRNEIWPRETQGISNWLNFTNYDSFSGFSRFLNVTEKQVDTKWANGPQVIVQAQSSVIPGGGNGTQQAGSRPKVMDITDTIRKLYNDRVSRFFKCTLGVSYGELFDHVKSKTDTNFGWVDKFHKDAEGNGEYKPLYFWNYRYMQAPHGMWLNDPWHHVPLQNDKPVTSGKIVDPIAQSQADRDSVVASVSSWDTNGLLEADADYKKYHPLSLLGYVPSPFTSATPDSTKPVPADTGYWRTSSDKYSVESFVMDLRQVQYETMRRNWRFEQPSVDATNATCPNPSCWVHDKGWTMGQLYENSQSTWGINATPNMSSKYCPACSVELDGVLYKDGDGIVTVSYDTEFEPNPVINAIEVDIANTDGWQPDAKHGFTIEYYNSVVDQWKSLIIVRYDRNTDKYIYREWNGSAWIQKQSSTLPSVFIGAEGNGSTPKAGDAAIGSHFLITTGCKVRFKVADPAVVNQTEPSNDTMPCTADKDKRTITVDSLSQPPRRYIGRSGTMYNTITGDHRTFVVTDVVKNANGSITLNVSAPVENEYTAVQFAWKEYVSKCTKFRVWGYPYNKGDLTITPPSPYQMISITRGNGQFRLDTWPSKILSVRVQIEDAYEVEMTESSVVDDTFVWSVEKDTIAGVQYLRVVGGKWYYDYKTNTLRLPTVYVDPDTNTKTNIVNLNADLYNADNTTFEYKTIPTFAVIEYLTGNGVSIDVGVSAIQQGPSYQLDRECVCFIANHSGDTEPLPEGYTSDPLPDVGMSVPLAKLNGQRHQMRWQVYNHNPLTWTPKIGWIVGNELPAGGWDDNTVLSVFSGGHGSVLSDPGPTSVLKGYVSGDVTLYGLPNTILSGNILVYAKAKTTRKYTLADGTEIITNERTGGYRSGAFVFRLTVADTLSGGSFGKRTGITCDVPKILIYLRERNMDESI